MTITLEAIRAAGGIVHSDGNIFFRDISMLQGLAGAAPAAVAPQGERQWICPTRTVADLANNLLTMDQALPIYGAQYIEKDGRRCAIAVPPTVSRERVQDGRWIGQGEELNAAVVWTRAEQPVAAPGLTDGQLDDESYRVNDEPGFADAFRAGARFAERVHGVTASAARAVTGKADWWRGRADEIEVRVARSGSQEAMGCFTDMRTLLQAAAEPVPPLAPVKPPHAITASLMRDDGGDAPAFCLMVAYRSEADARDAMFLLRRSQTAPAGSGGWEEHARQLDRELDYWRTQAKTMAEHQAGEAWYWQGDGEDHPESWVNTLPVVIRADQLRELMAKNTAPALEAPAAPSEADIASAREHIADVHNATQMRSALSQLRPEVVVELVARGLVPSIYAPMAAAPQAPAALDELRQIADIAACWGCEHPDKPSDTELLRRVKWAARQLRAVAQAPAAPSGDQASQDSICAWSVWWTHNKAKFTTPRQAALAAWNHANERALRAQAAPAAPAVDARDTARMNWLEAQVVNVRAPLRYGSRDMFWASPEEVDGGPDGPSDLRARIDAAQAAAKGADA
jgi:hypothetical protein